MSKMTILKVTLLLDFERKRQNMYIRSSNTFSYCIRLHQQQRTTIISTMLCNNMKRSLDSGIFQINGQ